MSNENDIDGVLRRIEKLLAIANCPSADPNEAAAAAGMAERIMRKYQVEHADIIMASLKRGEDMVQEDIVVTAKTNGTRVLRVPTWANIISTEIARFCGVGSALSWNQSEEACVRFVGFKNDVLMARWMLDYLAGTVNAFSLAFRSDPRYALGGRRAMNSYRDGVAFGICSKIHALTKQKEAETKVDQVGTNLVVVKDAALREKYAAVYFETKELTTRNNHQNSAFADGWRDGHKVAVDRKPLEGANAPLRLK